MNLDAKSDRVFFWRGVADGVDANKIEATFKNGVLTVTLPKTAEARKNTKTITLKAA